MSKDVHATIKGYGLVAEYHGPGKYFDEKEIYRLICARGERLKELVQCAENAVPFLGHIARGYCAFRPSDYKDLFIKLNAALKPFRKEEATIEGADGEVVRVKHMEYYTFYDSVEPADKTVESFTLSGGDAAWRGWTFIAEKGSSITVDEKNKTVKSFREVEKPDIKPLEVVGGECGTVVISPGGCVNITVGPEKPKDDPDPLDEKNMALAKAHDKILDSLDVLTDAMD